MYTHTYIHTYIYIYIHTYIYTCESLSRACRWSGGNVASSGTLAARKSEMTSISLSEIRSIDTFINQSRRGSRS